MSGYSARWSNHQHALYQRECFGKDYLNSLRDAFGDAFAKQVVIASYEVTDATIDRQVISLQGEKADVLISAAPPKFASQIILKVAHMQWKPTAYPV